MTDYEAMVAALRASQPKPAPGKKSGPPRALGYALWSAALVIGAACLAVYLSTPAPVPHHAVVPRCTVSAPCYASHDGGKIITAYVLVRTARGIIRMPLHAARLYYRMRMLRGPRVSFTLPHWGDGN